MASAQSGRRRIVIVSNRLPVSITKTQSGLQYHSSSGGLATGLRSMHESYDTLWVGWPGSVGKDDREEVKRTLLKDYGCLPVFISDHLAEKYYEGYSNQSIWPLFHSMPMYAKYSASEWEAYKRANNLFRDAILSVYKDGDRIWIHDYHLMMLPKYLREHLPHAALSFFLHIPFPHHEIFRLLPQHRAILQSLLSLDLIGVHTHDYAHAFVGSIRRLLGHDNTLGQLIVGDRAVQVDVFPMGIDFMKYAEGLDDKATQKEVESIRRSIVSKKIVFSVQRLDYTKGIPESLEAIKVFYSKHPEWHEKIVYLLVVVPSRERVDRYASLKREIDELVGSINSEFGTLGWTPVRYIYRSLTFTQLVALYSVADIALVTPLRDGMNLIAKEYLAVRRDNRGVLILSELAGAAKELMEAITVNPNSAEEIEQALIKALAMDEEEQKVRLTPMRARLEQHNLQQWIRRSFVRLDEALAATEALSVKLLDHSVRDQLIQSYQLAGSRLIVLDYDGTLVPFADEPKLAKADSELRKILKRLTRTERTKVVILSGRDRHTLQEWLGDLKLMLVSEHGGWARDVGEKDWRPVLAPANVQWMKDILPFLRLYVDRIPGSFVEEKAFSLVWHYRKADLESGSIAAKELLDMLSNFSMNLGVQILPGNKTVEVRNVGISKGAYYSEVLSHTASDFILAAGDDWTDEDLFSVLPESAYSMKVGLRVSKARYNVRSYRDIRSLLEQLEGD
jgi:trehalose 6-phosphate synthase/phosphatase